jgi:hypothetical protein
MHSYQQITDTHCEAENEAGTTTAETKVHLIRENCGKDGIDEGGCEDYRNRGMRKLIILFNLPFHTLVPRAHQCKPSDII